LFPDLVDCRGGIEAVIDLAVKPKALVLRKVLSRVRYVYKIAVGGVGWGREWLTLWFLCERGREQLGWAFGVIVQYLA
jgi:hypothetical protein